MEKRPQKTLARTLASGNILARCALAVMLFTPSLTGMTANRGLSAAAPQPQKEQREEQRESVRPRELVRIYSIVRSQRPDIAEPEIWRLSEVIYEETARRNLDPLMILALIRIESGFDAKAISPAGARGIMQIMPETGKKLAHRLSGEYGYSALRFTEESLDDPVLNLRLGIHYLHDLKKQFRNWTATLTAYNFGPGDTLSRIESNLALPEDFALLVLNAYEQYTQAPHSAF